MYFSENDIYTKFRQNRWFTVRYVPLRDKFLPCEADSFGADSEAVVFVDRKNIPRNRTCRTTDPKVSRVGHEDSERYKKQSITSKLS